MGVVEKAGGALHEVSGKKKKKKQQNAAPAKSFDLDYAQFKKSGLYYPDAKATQLAMELRAIKRRLLRRVGFLRASGDRQAFRRPGRQRNVVLITSSRAGEGKTFNALNIALSLAIEDQIETVLVDADIQRPKVRARLNLPAAKGLTDVLTEPAIGVDDVQIRAKQAPLTVIPEGSAVDRASELFAGDETQRLITHLSMQNPDGLIIIDAPPVLATTEAVILAKYVDEIVFVVEANATPEPAVASAVDELLDINPNVSLVLNRCLVGAGGSHYGSYEYYGSDQAAKRGQRVEPNLEGKGHDS